jgi:hypothetical protein
MAVQPLRESEAMGCFLLEGFFLEGFDFTAFSQREKWSRRLAQLPTLPRRQLKIFLDLKFFHLQPPDGQFADFQRTQLASAHGKPTYGKSANGQCTDGERSYGK